VSSRRDQDSQWRVPDAAFGVPGRASAGPHATASRGSGARRAFDLALRVFGGIVATWGGAMAATLEVFLVPLRIDGVRFPVTLLLVVVGNIVLMSFARSVTGNRLAALLPGLAWFVVTILLSGQTAEGDVVLLGNDWVPPVLLVLGAGSIAFGAYLVLVPNATLGIWGRLAARVRRLTGRSE
jgi:hypothetical protein